MGLRIDVAELDDQYIDFTNDEIYPYTTYPDIFSLTIGGQDWLTDRYWMLPADVCDLSGGEFKPAAMPEKSVETAVEWVRHMRSDPLLPATEKFAACFGGVLTKHGLAAYATENLKRLHVLAAGDDRVGLLMPHREPTDKSVTIPVTPAVVEMYRRIRGAHVGDLARWQSWDLAAYLTGDPS